MATTPVSGNSQAPSKNEGMNLGMALLAKHKPQNDDGPKKAAAYTGINYTNIASVSSKAPKNKG